MTKYLCDIDNTIIITIVYFFEKIMGPTKKVHVKAGGPRVHNLQLYVFILI